MAILFCPQIYGQNDSIPGQEKKSFTERTDMYFQMRGSFSLDMPHDANASAKFRMDDFRWNIEGTVGDNLYYRFRQSFTTVFQTMSLDNILSSVNYAYVQWKPVQELSLTAGKQVFAFGGHEFWANPLYVIHFSDFGSSFSSYQMGLSAEWDFTPSQGLAFQVCNFRGTSDAEYYTGEIQDGVEAADFPFIYTLNWNGAFLDDRSLEFRYSASYANQAKNERLWVLSLGQSFRKSKWGAYLDLMWSRQGLDASGIISREASFSDNILHTARNTEYFSAVAYMHFFFSPSFGAFVKGSGEYGGLYSPFMGAGAGACRLSWNAQTCLQYMPTKDNGFRLFAHYNYYGCKAAGDGALLGIAGRTDHMLTFGIIYIMDVF